MVVEGSVNSSKHWNIFHSVSLTVHLIGCQYFFLKVQHIKCLQAYHVWSDVVHRLLIWGMLTRCLVAYLEPPALTPSCKETVLHRHSWINLLMIHTDRVNLALYRGMSRVNHLKALCTLAVCPQRTESMLIQHWHEEKHVVLIQTRYI